jgi:hypothetical protein
VKRHLKCYQITGYCGHAKFTETTYSPTPARAVSNIKWKMHRTHPYVYIGDIRITAVKIYNDSGFVFEDIEGYIL